MCVLYSGMELNPTKMREQRQQNLCWQLRYVCYLPNSVCGINSLPGQVYDDQLGNMKNVKIYFLLSNHVRTK